MALRISLHCIVWYSSKIAFVFENLFFGWISSPPTCLSVQWASVGLECGLDGTLRYHHYDSLLAPDIYEIIYL